MNALSHYMSSTGACADVPVLKPDLAYTSFTIRSLMSHGKSCCWMVKQEFAAGLAHTRDEIHIGWTGTHSQGITTVFQGIAHPEGLLAWGPIILWASV